MEGITIIRTSTLRRGLLHIIPSTPPPVSSGARNSVKKNSWLRIQASERDFSLHTRTSTASFLRNTVMASKLSGYKSSHGPRTSHLHVRVKQYWLLIIYVDSLITSVYYQNGLTNMSIHFFIINQKCSLAPIISDHMLDFKHY